MGCFQWGLYHFKTIFLYSIRLRMGEVSYCVETEQLDTVVKPLICCRLFSFTHHGFFSEKEVDLVFTCIF